MPLVLFLIFFIFFYDLYVLCNQIRTWPITRLAIATDMATLSLYAQELGSKGPGARARRPVPHSLRFDVQAPPKLGPNAPQCPCHVTRIPGQGIPGPRNRSSGALGCTWFLQFPGAALNPGLYLPMSCTRPVVDKIMRAQTKLTTSETSPVVVNPCQASPYEFALRIAH